MQFERNRMYRVKAVAEALDVSVATIYRAIEAGKLNAFKIGTGKGALRVPGHALPAYLEECAQAAYDTTAQHQTEDTDQACVVCGADFIRSGNSHVAVGHSEAGTERCACVGDCEKRAASEQTGEVA